MAITHTWKITGLKTTTVRGSPDVIVQAYWEKIGEFEGVQAKFTGATPFDPSSIPVGYNFRPFSELTEDEVLEWVKATVVGGYADHVDSVIQKQIEEKKFPVVEAELPWSK